MEITQWYNDQHLPKVEAHMAQAPLWAGKTGEAA
ncbi:MAG: hypothetical protein JWR51_532 [Devosia sp.]|nr:hypothetical protein [Devosia sp.]